MSVPEFKAIIITLSDRASRGEYEDESGKLMNELILSHFNEIKKDISLEKVIIPDESDELDRILKKYIEAEVNFIFTTGGTGIGPRDITPEVVKPLLTKEIPGIMELIRVKYGLQFPAAALSRSIAGVAQNTLVYCLPGSPKAVKEYMQEILQTLLHCHRMLRGSDMH